MFAKYPIIAFLMGLLVMTSFNFGRNTLAQNNQSRIQLAGDLTRLPALVTLLVSDPYSEFPPQVTVVAGSDLSQSEVTLPFVLSFPEDATILGGVFKTYPAESEAGTEQAFHEIFYTTELTADEVITFYESNLGADFAKRNIASKVGDFRFLEFCYNPIEGQNGVLTLKANIHNEITQVSLHFTEMIDEEYCQVYAG